MKVNSNVLKASFVKSFSYTNKTILITKDFIKECNFNKRVIALVLMISLLLPAFLFGDWVKSVSAFQSNLISSLPQTSAPNAAPPVPFIISSSSTFSAKFASTVLTVNTTLANGFVSAVNLFKTPQMPEGFEMAQPVSPASVFLFSIGDSVRSFFGFFSTSSSSNAMLTPPPPVPAGSTSFDFDGDGKADIARWRSSTGAWEIQYSGTNLPDSGILAAGQLAPADYNGDGATDLASFNNGTWNILMGGQVTQITGFGQSGDVPVSGNYIGSSAADLAVWRPSNGTWYVREVGNATVTSYQFGQSGDIAVPGNYDGDSLMDYAVFRPNGGVWHIQGSLSGYYYAQWGVASDIPVPADYDGDGKTDMAVYRGFSGTWYAYKSSTNNGSYLSEIWGNYGDQPVPADYDGDGVADFSVFRPTSGVWHIYNSDAKDYSHHALGTPSDMAVSSAYIKQIGGQIVSYDLAKTRLSPKNATDGTNLYSRNFGWSSGLVNLPGRAGLDMGFGISYNSLIWTKFTDPNTSNTTMFFDIDNSNISPGFRFGFPTIEPVYYETQTGSFSYMMVTPSGSRTEFKQIGASDTYETVDSSYTQLKTTGAASPNDPVENITITLTGTDGTQMKYNWRAGAFRASEIKDRNGNFITIVHDDYGNLQSVTDTLGRIINVNYDENLYPTSITQTWKNNNGTGSNITHYWARFQYTTITVNPDFNDSYGVYGPTGGAPVKVLEKIIRADDSATIFEYQQNTFGQVSKIRNMAPDGHEVNYVQTNLVSPGTNLNDCPRLSQTKTWAENFNGGAERVVNNTLQTGHQVLDLDGNAVTASLLQVSMQNHPTGNITNTYVGETGWMEGLPIRVDDYANGSGGLELKRSNWMKWTQDDTNLSYIKNPRVLKTKTGDSSSVRRTEIDYWTTGSLAAFGLVKEVRIYNNTTNALQKKSVTYYNDDTAYLSRRIIGLPSQSELYDENDVLMSKVTYGYDGGNFSQETNQNISSVIRHDNTNYSASFISGRGNLTSITRHAVTGSASSTTSNFIYDIAGSLVAQTDPLNRKMRVEYTDVFNDTTTTRNTFAYPTKIFDPANNYSEIKYRFDTGANVWAKNPDLNANTPGQQSTREYDSVGRLSKEAIINHGGAYTRYEYPTNGVQLKVYKTVIDATSNGADVSDEVYAESWTDGAGRTLKSRTENPGSSGGWTGGLTEYDILGRIKRLTVPTEINSNYAPAGDDVAQGWLWKQAEYDWKSRVTREINTDGTDKLISYEGCGCAGGQITTIQGELVPNPLQSGTFTRRTKKIYADILGRTYKTENYDWDGTTVHSTIKIFFNGRDQQTLTRQYAGDENSNYQDTTFQYDGFGRVWKTHKPEQRDGSDVATYTTYAYNADDSIQSMTDARGATTTYTYNNPLGLLTDVTYSGSNIPTTHSLTFDYDDAGNRISMSDGLGTVTYGYDELSRLKFETREFDDTLTDQTVPSGGFKIEYNYTLGGQLKSYKDPYNREFQFTLDRIGRNTAVTGTTAYGGVTNYSSNYQYRAFGSVKQIFYGNQTTATMTYNNRLQPSSYRLNDSTQTLFGKDYYYTTTGNNDNDGLLKRSVHYDNTMTADEQAKRNQLNTYDALGRIIKSETGEVQQGSFGLRNGPFQQTYTYNAFGNVIDKDDRDFGLNQVGCSGCPRTISYSESIVNNRTQSSTLNISGSGQQSISNYQYDNDGRLISRDGDEAQFDAAGKMIFFEGSGYYSYDGDGNLLKWVRAGTTSLVDYYVKSSVFGANVLELDSTGAMTKEFVFSSTGSQIAYLKDNEVVWMHEEPSGKERYSIKQDRTAQYKSTYDPTGTGATNNGYSGGGICPPNSCYSPENSAMLAQTNRGFDGLERLTRWRNAQWLQSHQFELYDRYWNTPIGWVGVQGGNPVVFPGQYPPDGDTYPEGPLEPIFESDFRFFIIYIEEVNLNNNTTFDKCITYSKLGSFDWGEPFGTELANFGSKQADLILNAFLKENKAGQSPNVTPAMLAFTWRRETIFELTPKPNPNLENNPSNNTQFWDVGPVHINRDYSDKFLKNGKLSFAGLDEISIYGTSAYNAYEGSGLPKSFRGYGNSELPFNGDIVQNLRAGMRRLEIAAGSARERVAYYGPESVREERRQHWDKVGGAWNSFFSCYGAFRVFGN